MLITEEREALKAMLKRLVWCDENPQEGPFYIHEMVQDEALLIKVLRLQLGEAE